MVETIDAESASLGGIEKEGGVSAIGDVRESRRRSPSYGS